MQELGSASQLMSTVCSISEVSWGGMGAACAWRYLGEVTQGWPRQRGHFWEPCRTSSAWAVCTALYCLCVAIFAFCCNRDEQRIRQRPVASPLSFKCCLNYRAEACVETVVTGSEALWWDLYLVLLNDNRKKPNQFWGGKTAKAKVAAYVKIIHLPRSSWNFTQKLITIDSWLSCWVFTVGLPSDFWFSLSQRLFDPMTKSCLTNPTARYSGYLALFNGRCTYCFSASRVMSDNSIFHGGASLIYSFLDFVFPYQKFLTANNIKV